MIVYVYESVCMHMCVIERMHAHVYDRLQAVVNQFCVYFVYMKYVPQYTGKIMKFLYCYPRKHT